MIRVMASHLEVMIDHSEEDHKEEVQPMLEELVSVQSIIK